MVIFVTKIVCKKRTRNKKQAEQGIKCDVVHIFVWALCYLFVILITRYFRQDFSECDRSQTVSFSTSLTCNSLSFAAVMLIWAVKFAY